MPPSAVKAVVAPASLRNRRRLDEGRMIGMRAARATEKSVTNDAAPSLADLDDETRTIAGSLRRGDAQRGDRGGSLARRLGGELRPARGDRHLGLIERQRECRQRLLVEVVLLHLRD